MELSRDLARRVGALPLITGMAVVILGAIAVAIPSAPIRPEGAAGRRGYLLGHTRFSETMAQQLAGDGYNFLAVDLTNAEGGTWERELAGVSGRRFPVWGWIEINGRVERAARRAAEQAATAHAAATREALESFHATVAATNGKMRAALGGAAPPEEAVRKYVSIAIETALQGGVEPATGKPEDAVKSAANAAIMAGKRTALSLTLLGLPEEFDLDAALLKAATLLGNMPEFADAHAALDKAAAALRNASEAAAAAKGLEKGGDLEHRAKAWRAAAMRAAAERDARAALAKAAADTAAKAQSETAAAIAKGIAAAAILRDDTEAPAIRAFARAVEGARALAVAARRAEQAQKTAERASADHKLKHLVPGLNLAGLFLYGPGATGRAARMNAGHPGLRVIPVIGAEDDEPDGEFAVAMEYDAFVAEAAQVALPVLLADRLTLDRVDEARKHAGASYLVATLPLNDSDR